MPEEIKAPEGASEQPQVSDHVRIDKDGGIFLSEEAATIMEGKEPEVKEPEKKEEKKETPTQPEVKEEPKKEPEKQPETPKRKIKWQGQDVEIEPDKEVEFIQKGYDYTQKMQTLAAERDLMTANVGLIKAVEQDPMLRQKIADHLKGVPEAKKEEVPKFDDPIEQLKYELKQDILKDVREKEVKPLNDEQKAQQHMLQVQKYQMQMRQDPLYNEVQAEIINKVKSLPEQIGRNLFYQLDQDIPSYHAMYQQVRQEIAAKKPKDEIKKPDGELPTPIKKEEHAPLLEGAEKNGGETSQQKVDKRIKELTRRAQKNNDFQALGELIELRYS